MAQRRELPGIDALRLGACLVIAAFHAKFSGLTAAYLPALGTLAGPAALGQSMTGLFVALSGFVLHYAYAGAASDGRPRRSARAFWRARAARLVPLMLVGHLIAAPFALLGATRYGTGEALWRGLLALTATQAWFPRWAISYDGPAWTLSVLAFGYLLFPWLTARLERVGQRATAALLLGTWAASVSASVLVLRAGNSAFVRDFGGTAFDIVHVFPPIRALEFASGVLLGHLWRVSAASLTRWVLVALAPAAALVAALATSLLGHEPARVLGFGGLMPLWWAVTWAVASLRIASERGQAAARLLGRASFSVYVLHDPLLGLLNVALFRGVFGAHGGVALAAWFVLLVPIGLASERWFVGPLARRLDPRDRRDRRDRRRVDARPAPAAPVTG